MLECSDDLFWNSFRLKIEVKLFGFVYESKVSLGDLKKTFQNGVYDGIKKGIQLGPKGWPLTDLKVSFIFSEYDSVNSTPSDFRNLAPEVIQSALELSGTQLLEPLFMVIDLFTTEGVDVETFKYYR